MNEILFRFTVMRSVSLWEPKKNMEVKNPCPGLSSMVAGDS